MNKYKIWTHQHINEDHVFEADGWVQDGGYLGFYRKTGDDTERAVANFAPGSWYLVETLSDETIPSNSPKEAPQG